MEKDAIQKAKTKLSGLIKKARQADEIAISPGSMPVAPHQVALEESPAKRKPGAWKGRISLSEDAFAPLTEQELKDLGFDLDLASM